MVDRLKEAMRSKDRKTQIKAQRERAKFGDLSKKPRTTSTTKRERRARPVYTKQQQMLMKMGVRPGSEKFGEVKMRPAPKTMKKMALGGEAGESVGRATVEKRQRAIRRQAVDDMLDRVYRKKPTIKPKKKPKPPLKKKMKDKIVPKKKPKLKPLKKPSEMKGLPPKRG